MFNLLCFIKELVNGEDPIISEIDALQVYMRSEMHMLYPEQVCDIVVSCHRQTDIRMCLHPLLRLDDNKSAAGLFLVIIKLISGCVHMIALA